MSGKYLKDGEEIGAATGTKVEYKEGGTLTWTRTFSKKPGPSLPASVAMIFKLTPKGAQLSFTQDKMRQTRAMTRQDGAAAKPAPDPKADPKPDPKAAPAADGYALVDELRGSKTLSGMQAAFSPDGMRVAMFSPKAKAAEKPHDEVAIWDFKEKKVVQRLAPKGGIGHRLAWSADGGTLVAAWFAEDFGDAKATWPLAVFDAATWEEKAGFDSYRYGRVSVSGDGKRIGIGIRPKEQDEAGDAVILDAAMKKEVSRFKTNVRGDGPDVLVSKDGKSAVVAGPAQGGVLFVIDAATGKARQSYPTGRYPMAIGDDGKTLAAAHSRSEFYKGKSTTLYGVIVYDTAAGPKAGKEYLFDMKGSVDFVGLLDGGKQAVLAGSGDEVPVMDTKTGKVLHSIVPVKNVLTANMLVSADTSRILVISGDWKTRVYSTPFGKK